MFRLMVSEAKKLMAGPNLSNCHSCRHAAVFISWSHFVEVATTEYMLALIFARMHVGCYVALGVIKCYFGP